MKRFMNNLLLLLALNPLNVPLDATSQTIATNPDKRLKAIISADSMNRLAVANDRITQIFGDQEAYEVQTEESTGQLFLKPTLENGKKPLAITLITENGLTQDMTLEPVERDAATVILKNAGTFSGTGNDLAKPMHHLSFSHGMDQGMMAQGLGQHAPGFGPALGFQDQVIAAMKYLVSGSAPTLGIDNFDRKGPKGIEIGLIEAFHLGNFKGFKLDVKNAGDVPMDIQEKDFYRAGDLAFYVENRVLSPKTSTIMYVVTRG